MFSRRFLSPCTDTFRLMQPEKLKPAKTPGRGMGLKLPSFDASMTLSLSRIGVWGRTRSKVDSFCACPGNFLCSINFLLASPPIDNRAIHHHNACLIESRHASSCNAAIASYFRCARSFHVGESGSRSSRCTFSSHIASGHYHSFNVITTFMLSCKSQHC